MLEMLLCEVLHEPRGFNTPIKKHYAAVVLIATTIAEKRIWMWRRNDRVTYLMGEMFLNYFNLEKSESTFLLHVTK